MKREKMITLKREKVGYKKYIWWVLQDTKRVLGFEKFNQLKEHFRESLKIDKNKKVRVINEDKFIENIVFI